MEIGLIGLDEIGNKKKRQEKREERKEKKEDRKEKRQEKREDRKEKRQDRKEDRKEKKQDRKNKRAEKREKRGGSRAKKFFLAPSRAAFFILMKVNFLQLRKKLREAWKKDKAQVESKIIRKFGFKRENFLKELNRKETEQLSGAFGEAATASAAAVAQSTPILTQVIQVLSALGIAAGALTSARAALKGKDKEMADEFTEGVEDNLNDPTIPEGDRTQGGGQSGDDFKEKPEIKEEGGSGLMSGKMPLILGLGAAALIGLYFFTKKK